jgi:hypothetical protein
MGKVKITGSVIGSAASACGEIYDEGALASLTIGGSLIGGGGSDSGHLFAGPVGALKITGDVVGGSATGTVTLEQSGYIEAERIATLTIGGALIAGTNNTSGTFDDNGAIRVDFDLGVVRIGNIAGNATNPAILSALGQAKPTTTDVAIGSLTVKGGVEFAHILAGYATAGTAEVADAQVGPVSVGGDWVASSLVAGATAGADGVFGTGDDQVIPGGKATISSRISSVTIGGQVLGTVGDSDHFGIVAQNVVSLKVGGTPIPLTPGNGNDDLVIGVTGDFTVHEI